MSDPNYGARVVLALQGLVPIAWMERCVRLCADPSKPAAEELWPADEEREQMLDKLVLADGLACGEPKRSPGALAALAKAISVLALAPGGVAFLGHRWWAAQTTDGLVLRDESAEKP